MDFGEYHSSSAKRTSQSKATREPLTPFNAIQSHAVLASATPYQSTPAIGPTGASGVQEGLGGMFDPGYSATGATGAVNFDINDTSTWNQGPGSLYTNMGMGVSTSANGSSYVVNNADLARKYEMSPDMQSSVYQDSTRARLQDTQLYINEENNFNIIATMSISTLIMAAIMMGASGGGSSSGV